MNNSRFDIIAAVIHGVRFTVAERRYLIAAMVLPYVLTLLTNVASFFLIEKQAGNILSAALITLPASAASAWFMFVQARLILFGERLGSLPSAPEFTLQRHNDLNACVLTWVLFKMAVIGISAYLLWWKDQGSPDTFDHYSMIGMLMIGATFWGLRLSVAHILVATGYSVKQYIFRVNGAMVSLRLLGMGILISIPFEIFSEPLARILTQGKPPPGQMETIFLLAALSAVSCVLMALLNAAAVFALKEMLGQQRDKRGVKKK